MTNNPHTDNQSLEPTCPGCDKHCPLNTPQCGRGRMYLQMQEKGLPLPAAPSAVRSELHDDMLALFLRCSHLLGRGRQHGKSQPGQSQGRILMILDRMGGTISQKELQDILQIRAASLSELLSKLEKSELITRSKEENDRRSSLIQLTEKGKAHVNAHAQSRQHAAQTLFQCLSPEEQQQLAQLLTKLSQHWSQQFADFPESNHSHHGRGRRRQHGALPEILHPEDQHDPHHL